MTALATGLYLLAGAVPLCRPATVYRVATLGDEMVTMEVVYAPASPYHVGRRTEWWRSQIEAACRLGDVRLRATWSAPHETLKEARDRLLDRPQVGTKRARRARLVEGGGPR